MNKQQTKLIRQAASGRQDTGTQWRDRLARWRKATLAL